MKTSDFFYNLPEELIAQKGTEKRDESRLLVYNRADQSLLDTFFYQIGKWIKAGDCLVLYNTRVLPARLIGRRETEDGQGGKIEFVLLRHLEGDDWESIVKPGKRAREGVSFVFGSSLKAKVISVLPDGNRIVRFEYSGVFQERLDEVGQMPLPPYIHEKLEDKERYQTVYAQKEGSAAAPTAGLHFTQALLEKLKMQGVEIAQVLLHVGLGTFRPVKVENVDEHHMHSEYYEVSKEAANTINQARKNGGRIICVGTTSARTLETVADEKGIVQVQKGYTDIFIKPGYRFKAVDALITNFHLPESTLLMLVSALCSREEMLKIYEHAVKEKYRFFSFGDAMMIQ